MSTVGFGDNTPVLRYDPTKSCLGKFLGWVNSSLEVVEHYHPWDEGSNLSYGLDKSDWARLGLTDQKARVTHWPPFAFLRGSGQEGPALMELSNISYRTFFSLQGLPERTIVWSTDRHYDIWPTEIAGIHFYIALPVAIPCLRERQIFQLVDQLARQRDYALIALCRHQHGIAGSVVAEAAKRPDW